MKTIGVQSRVSPAVIAVVPLLQLSPGLAAGQPDAQQATIQGSRFPGMPMPRHENNTGQTSRARRSHFHEMGDNGNFSGGYRRRRRRRQVCR